MAAQAKGSSVQSGSSNYVPAVRDVLVTIRSLEARKADIEQEIAVLKGSVLEYVEVAGNYEDDDFLATRVQGFTRTWDGNMLLKIVGAKMYGRITTRKPDPAKIDELVRANVLDSKKIAPAFIETPKSAYIKITAKKQGESDKAADEAARVKGALG